jgi:alpha-galactosidase
VYSGVIISSGANVDDFVKSESETEASCAEQDREGPARLPTLGWNSWYALGKSSGWPLTREDVILETASALVSTGLRDAGYTTLVIDDSW